jgi:hypothetical protein
MRSTAPKVCLYCGAGPKAGYVWDNPAKYQCGSMAQLVDATAFKPGYWWWHERQCEGKAVKPEIQTIKLDYMHPLMQVERYTEWFRASLTPELRDHFDTVNAELYKTTMFGTARAGTVRGIFDVR